MSQPLSSRFTMVLTGSLAFACGAPPPAESPTSAATPAPAAAPAPVATAPAAPAAPAAAAPAPVATTPELVLVTVTNPLKTARRETLSLSLAELTKVAPNLDPQKTLVSDAQGKTILSQIVDSDGDEAPDQLVFQTELDAGGSETFKLSAGERKLASRDDYKVYGRFVRERFDDFAWENDLVAHRMYGPALETAKKEPLISSGIDAWSKRVPRLLVNEWYMTGDYHQDHGDGADFYSVGKSRGCGGLGIWSNGKLFVSKNFTTSRVLANGPIRLIFELSYAPFDAGGGRVGETKRVTLDAGSYFNHFESTFTGGRALAVALGIAKHPGSASNVDAATASLRTWEQVDAGKSGNMGCAIVLAPGTKLEEQPHDLNYLAVTTAKPKEALSYYVGSAWDRAGHVQNAAAWLGEIQSLSNRIGAPVQVKLTAGPGAGPAPAAAPVAPGH